MHHQATVVRLHGCGDVNLGYRAPQAADQARRKVAATGERAAQGNAKHPHWLTQAHVVGDAQLGRPARIPGTRISAGSIKGSAPV